MTAARPTYSEVLEDYAVLSRALDVRASDLVVVVSSAGDNVFNTVLEGGRHVFGVDIDASQTAFCRLKEAAALELSWEEFALLVGAREGDRAIRAATLERLPADLVAAASGDVEVRQDIELSGLVACGRLAAFVAPLREGLLQLIGRETMERILSSDARPERETLFEQHFETPPVLELLGAALNEESISDAFIPASAWGHMAEPTFHRFYHGVLRRLIVEQDPRTNHFLHRLWLDRFPSASHVPPYLRRDRYERLQHRLDHVTWHTAELGAFLATLPGRSVDVLNISNVLDWCEDEQHDDLWAEIDRVAAPGARLFLRSFLNQRTRPSAIRNRWERSQAQSQAMMRADRVGYYSRYELWVRVRDCA